MDQSKTTPDHWAPDGAPLFNGPEARALSRVGVVDVGSNSVRMVVFDGAARSPAYFFNEKVMCGLGAGLRETGRLNPKGRERALAALHRFAALAEGMDTGPLSCVATAAVRDAEDGPDFCKQVERETGLKLHVIDGREEARLSAQGVLLGWPGSEGLICDIGGASMELAEIGDGGVGRRLTSDLGPLKLMGMAGGKKALLKHIRKTVEQLYTDLGEPKGQRLFLVGGSWRAIARIDMERTNYPLHVLHEYRMTVRDIGRTGKFIDNENPDYLRSRCGVSSTRMGLVPIASLVLRQLVQTFKPRDICVSSYGIREGMLFEQMPQKLRDLDPLIEACYFAEAKDARLPGFGQTLFSFVSPLFPRMSDDKKRLIHAACLLHDVSWRAHPDFRSEVCFEMATRSNLGGMAHDERVFLGLALMHRYANKPPLHDYEPMLTLLSERQRREAVILGKAMRLGAMLWQKPGEQPAGLHWRPQKKILELRLTPAAAPLFGEVAQTRFQSLANGLGATTKVR